MTLKSSSSSTNPSSVALARRGRRPSDPDRGRPGGQRHQCAPAGNAAEAKKIVLDLIPDGSQVHSGASRSLDVAGISEEIEGSARYEAVRHIFSASTATPRPTRSAACPRPRT